MSGDRHPNRRSSGDEEREVARLTEELRRIADAHDASADPEAWDAAPDGQPGQADLLRLAEALLAAKRCLNRHARIGLFAEPAYDILLALYVSHHHGAQVSVSGACIAAGVPATTALRWIARLQMQGLLLPEADARDHRRLNLRLTGEAFTLMDDYLTEAGSLIQPVA